MTTEPQPQENPVPASGGLMPPTATAPAPPAPPPPPEFSVELSIPYPQRQSRLLLFGKWFTVIPLVFWLWAYSLVAGAVGLIGMVIVLFAGRYPRGMWDFYRRFSERQWKVQAYFPFLLTDSWTGKGVELHVDYPERQSRLLVLARIVLTPLVSILTAGVGFFLYLAIVLAWFSILFTGRQPRDFFNFTLSIVQWQARVNIWTSNLRDERRLFRAPKSVWIANALGLAAFAAIIALGGTGLVFSYREAAEARAIVEDFMSAGVVQDVTHAMTLFDEPEDNFRAVEKLFGQRELFVGFISLRLESWQYNTGTGRSRLELAGTLDYTTQPDGQFSALLIKDADAWKLQSIRVTRTPKVS